MDSTLGDLPRPIAIPVVVISLIGVAVQVIVIARNAITRDDVWYTKNTAACDFIETRVGYPAPNRKFKHYDNKNPPGLLEALQGNVNGPPIEPEQAKKKK